MKHYIVHMHVGYALDAQRERLRRLVQAVRDGLPGNKFSPTDRQVADELADELADVLTYLDLLAAMLAATLGVDLGRAAAQKFNEVSERVGFPDRIELAA